MGRPPRDHALTVATPLPARSPSAQCRANFAACAMAMNSGHLPERETMISVKPATQSGAPAWKTIPSWDVIGQNDHIVTAAEQLFMAKRAGAHITEIDAPHLSMISNPGVVASVIIQAARATS